MRYTIAEEWRGATMWQDVASMSAMIDGSPAGGLPKPWVARIIGRHPIYRFAREFIRPVLDYSGANSKGTRGVMLYWHLGDGVYQVCLGRKLQKSFIRIADGKSQSISHEEVEQWVDSRPENENES